MSYDFQKILCNYQFHSSLNLAKSDKENQNSKCLTNSLLTKYFFLNLNNNNNQYIEIEVYIDWNWHYVGTNEYSTRTSLKIKILTRILLNHGNRSMVISP